MPAEALRVIRDRIERGWSQGADAKDVNGQPVSPAGGDACAWSVVASFALADTNGIPLDRVPRAQRAFVAVTDPQSLEEWNDDPTRTKRLVLDALDAAIEWVESDRE